MRRKRRPRRLQTPIATLRRDANTLQRVQSGRHPRDPGIARSRYRLLTPRREELVRLGVQSAGLAWIQQADSAEAALITTPQSAAETPTATTEAGARNETSRKAGCKESVQSRNQVHVSIQTHRVPVFLPNLEQL